MPATFRFPKAIEGYVGQVPMFLTPIRQPDPKQVQVLAKVFKVEGEVVDEGAMYSIRGKDFILHQFHASDSMRWVSRMHEAKSDTKALKITNPKELQAIADRFLAAQELSDQRASFSQVIFGQAEISGADAEEPKTMNTCAYVNYTYSLAGLPLLGPGAKIQVVIGYDGQVIGCYRFWREVKEGRLTKKTLPVLDVQKAFQECPNFAQLKTGSRVIVERARQGYLTLPPSDFQGALIPVIELRGFVSTRAIERTSFIRYLVAIDYTDEELKRYSVFNKHFRGTCRVI